MTFKWIWIANILLLLFIKSEKRYMASHLILATPILGIDYSCFSLEVSVERSWCFRRILRLCNNVFWTYSIHLRQIFRRSLSTQDAVWTSIQRLLNVMYVRWTSKQRRVLNWGLKMLVLWVTKYHYVSYRLACRINILLRLIAVQSSYKNTSMLDVSEIFQRRSHEIHINSNFFGESEIEDALFFYWAGVVGPMSLPLCVS